MEQEQFDAMTVNLQDNTGNFYCYTFKSLSATVHREIPRDTARDFNEVLRMFLKIKDYFNSRGAQKHELE